MRNALFIIILLLATFRYNYAQEGDDISSCFDDGGISNASNIFSFNICGPVVGDYAVFYEHIFNKTYAVEFGLGYIPYYGFEYPGLRLTSVNMNDTLTGYSFRMYPKYYLQHMGPEFNSIGFVYRLRKYNVPNGDHTTFKDIAIMYGAHIFLGNRIVFEYDIGLGRRTITSKMDDSESLPKHTFVAPLYLKLGYKF